MNAPRDNNHIPAILGTLNTDGVSVVPIAVNPTNHKVKISDGTSGSGFSYVNAERDQNRVPAIWGVSSADGITPIPIYCDSTGAILIKST